MGTSALLLTLFIPLVGSLALLFINSDEKKALKITALVVSILTFIAALGMLPSFDRNTAAMQFSISQQWIPALDAGFRIGIDGTSLLLLLLAREAFVGLRGRGVPRAAMDAPRSKWLALNDVRRDGQNSNPVTTASNLTI